MSFKRGVCIIIVLFFLAANSKRGGLVRLHSFQKTSEVRGADLEQSEQRKSEEQTQSAGGFTPEEANKTNSLDSKVVADVTQRAVEQNEVPLQSCDRVETQVVSKEDQITGESSIELVNQETPLMPSTDTCISDDQNNFSVTLCSTPSIQSNPLSPFIPKKRSLEEQQVLTDLIQFADNPKSGSKVVDVGLLPAEAGGDAMPSEEVQCREETNRAVQKERKLSNARQPSLESDQSAVVCMFCFINEIDVYNNSIRIKRRRFSSNYTSGSWYCTQNTNDSCNLIHLNALHRNHVKSTTCWHWGWSQSGQGSKKT